jgi:uncharacterized membrane protein
MIVLVIGLAVFLGVHLVPTVPSLRAALSVRWGEQRYKGIFSLAAFAGLALIVAGYALGERGPQLYAPSSSARAAAPAVMTVSFVLFAAANMRGHLRHTLRHPMLLGLLLWSGVHLLANGDLRGTVLFGAFFAYGVVDLVSAVARGTVKTFEPIARHDGIAIVGGIAAALVVMGLHRWLFGVKVVAFGV